MIRILLMAVCAYLVGSIPFGYLAGRARGVDLRKVGSGNIGSTNTYRALGLKIAVLVFALDVGKGFVCTRVVPAVGANVLGDNYLKLLSALAAIVGSVASIFMRFRGGKGVATGAGVFLGLAPAATGICFAIWAGLVAVFRFVSLGSLAAAAALPVLVAVLGRPTYYRDPVFYLAVAVAAIVFTSHRSNIARLLAGRENRVGRRGTMEGHQ